MADFSRRAAPSIEAVLSISTSLKLILSIIGYIIEAITRESIDDLNSIFGWALFTLLIAGPIIGCPLWILRELFKRSRQRHFSQRTCNRFIVILFIGVVSCLAISAEFTFIVLFAFACVFARLKYPRASWPRFLRIYGPRWFWRAIFGIICLYALGATLELPEQLVAAVSISIPALCIFGALFRTARIHRGHHLKLPRRCVLLLRPFGFDDENFIEVDRKLSSLLDPNPGLPFDTFVCTSVEKRLGTFTAFGDPSDLTLRRGARRFYVTDAHWQAIFDQVVGRSHAFLAIVANVSEGLMWEIMRLRQLNLHTRLFLFTSPSRKRRRKLPLLAVYERVGQFIIGRQYTQVEEASWQEAAFNLRKIGYHLTDYPGRGAVIGFTADCNSLVLAQNCVESSEFIEPVEKMLYSTCWQSSHVNYAPST